MFPAPQAQPLDAAGAAKQAARVSRARRDLVTDDPLHGVCLLSLNVKADEGIGTGATDATDLWYAPSWVAQQTDQVVRTFLAHEVLHCELLHPFRMAGKDPDDWNSACDHVVNLALQKTHRAGVPYYRLWDGALCDPRYEGLSAEAVYAKLRKAKDDEKRRREEERKGEGQKGEQGGDFPVPSDRSGRGQQPQPGQQAGQKPGQGKADPNGQPQPGQGGAPSDQGNRPQPGQGRGEQPGQGQGKPGQGGAPGKVEQPGGFVPGATGKDKANGRAKDGGKAESAEGAGEPMTEGDWAGIVEQTTRGVRRAGKLSGDVERAIKDSREAVLDWRALLREHITNSVPDDVSWLRPNKRYLWRGIYLPGPVRENVGYIGLAIDTSGSVSRRELDAFAAEAQGILQEARPERLEVVYCDSSIKGTQSFEPDDDVKLEPKGGGGTAFAPVFEHFEHDPPLCLVYITDLKSRDYGTVTDPGVPVLWCTPAHITAVGPFGDTVRLDPR